MALHPSISFIQNINGITGVITDTTPDYAISGNPDRASVGNYLLWSKNDKSGIRTYSNPTQTTPLVTSTYTVDTTKDGWNQATLIVVGKYNNANPYVPQTVDGQGVISQYASIIYYTATNKFYSNIQASIGIKPDDPTGASYWTEITDMSTILNNSNVTLGNLDVPIQVVTDKAIKNQFYAKINVLGPKTSLKDMEAPLRIYFLSVGANSKFSDGKPDQYEEIITTILEMSGVTLT